MSALPSTRRNQVRSANPDPGVSLARGPALILGTVLLAAGLFFLYRLHSFPRFGQFPSGEAHITGHAFFGIFGVNGWSGELTAVAGGLLLFGAAQHLLAKTASLIVGVSLGFAAVFAVVHHHSVLGLFAANVWTIVLWGASAALLLINSLLPRAGSTAGTVVTSPTVPPLASPPPLEPVPAADPEAPSAAPPVTPASGHAGAEPTAVTEIHPAPAADPPADEAPTIADSPVAPPEPARGTPSVAPPSGPSQIHGASTPTRVPVTRLGPDGRPVRDAG